MSIEEEGTTSVDTTTPEEQDARDAMVKAAEAAMAAGDDGDDDDDPQEAARKRNARPLNATHEEGEDAPVGDGEDDDDGEGEQPPPKKKDEEKPLSKLAKELAARETKRKVEAEASARIEEAESVLSEAKQVSQVLAQREQQVAAREQAVDNFLAEAKRNPMTVLRKMGWSPDQFIEAAMKEKDPNYQTQVRFEQELSVRDRELLELKGMVRSLVAKANGWEQEAQQVHQQNEVKSFFESIPESSPVWQEGDEEDILYRANKIRRQYKEKTGKLATPAEIAEYMHYEALQKRGGAPAGTAGRGSAKADKTRANGSRALGNSDASERRSSGGRPMHGLEGDEERAALIRAAEAAIADD